ncbi:MAG: selenide, water dikinase SelD [Lentisphaeraceae bacterium]|nr:selenide, water dikinase SelD [Lentisphaeraceae bacterium]
MNDEIKLTKLFQTGGKLPAAVLQEILHSDQQITPFADLIVGNESNDDAAVYDIGGGNAVISTTDFIIPVVDDAFDFGRIAACNAINNIFAMGGKPLMAKSILSWPTQSIQTHIAIEILHGARSICQNASIPLVNGHIIDSPAPIFGLALTGIIKTEKLKRNDTAQVDDRVYLTKKLGTGILMKAKQENIISTAHMSRAINSMCTLNEVAYNISRLKGVTAMTTVNTHGLLGHMLKVCKGSRINASLYFNSIALLPGVNEYRRRECIPKNTEVNFDDIKNDIEPITEEQKHILCDSQTSGGLLIFVNKCQEKDFLALCKSKNLELKRIGKILPRCEGPYIQVN